MQANKAYMYDNLLCYFANCIQHHRHPEKLLNQVEYSACDFDSCPVFLKLDKWIQHFPCGR